MDANGNPGELYKRRLPSVHILYFFLLLKLFLLLVVQNPFYKVIRLTYKYRVLLPARKLAFTKVNIMKAWEVVGIIPLNGRRVIASETLSGRDGVTTKLAHASKKSQTLSRTPGPARTPRAVSRTARSAIALITRNTPASQKLKHILSDLNEGFQETYADKVLAEEAHRQYRELVGGKKQIKTNDRRKLTEATVVTAETILELREQRERLDRQKEEQKARKLAKALGMVTGGKGATPLPPKKKKEVKLASDVIIHAITSDREGMEWEDQDNGNESDGSEYKGSLGGISLGIGKLSMSNNGGLAGREGTSGRIVEDSTVRRSRRIRRM